MKRILKSDQIPPPPPPKKKKKKTELKKSSQCDKNLKKSFWFSTLRDVSYNARWFWTTIRYGPMTTAYLCWTTGNGF